jgi:hypothetical protein
MHRLPLPVCVSVGCAERVAAMKASSVGQPFVGQDGVVDVSGVDWPA